MNYNLSELTSNTPIVVMLGMCKNAGKTTALNRLIYEYKNVGRQIAVTSIGRDGEVVDVVTGTSKPLIYIYEGMLAATASGLLQLSDVSREILDVTSTATPLGMVVVFRARGGGYTQLAGPSTLEDMSRLLELLHSLGAETVLIDGALNRRSPAALSQGGVCILSTGASLSPDMDAVVDETEFACRVLTLPEIRDQGSGDRGQGAGSREQSQLGMQNAELRMQNFEGPEGSEQSSGVGGQGIDISRKIVFSGALTDSEALKILKSSAKLEGLQLIVEDSSKILIKRETFERLLANGACFMVKRATKLAAVTVNPISSGGWQFDADRFLTKMQQAVSVPVVDVGGAITAEG